ncbi:MAG TPA: NADH-quinone oxidoreductase subunit L [Candidatus Polarisedimenticolia bacterium]|nr:NADH-quinone oxidoreductase subunit L [Candidatus Polarisedimenticolia bacterium]
MIELAALMPAVPLLGAVLLGLAGRRMTSGAARAVGVGSAVLAALTACAAAAAFVLSPPPGGATTAVVASWWRAGDLAPAFGLRLDGLAVAMSVVVTVVGALIHLFAAEFMAGEERISRFFAWMNLFLASMLVLVLASDLVVLYLGWEGVGLCSYLLIGFWHRDAANARAARKAFLVTRIGDAAMALGLIVLFVHLGTLEIAPLLEKASAVWSPGAVPAVVAAALLLAGAAGKSAQFPLHTWLPDAMAGPTPVSALIHAATMVTAGVYLVARMAPLFLLAPPVMLAVAVAGALTLLLGAAAALAQNDIKRTLAYSTMSQVGLMFLALGVGAWAAAIAHLATHAVFKALLFLSAGAVTSSLEGHEHDLRRMGGLRGDLPLVFAAFTAGAAALAGLPLITSGFYSKEAILSGAWGAERAGAWWWAAAMLGATLTSLYAFRLVFLVFAGERRTPVARRPGAAMAVPLAVLGALALTVGLLEIPRWMGGRPLISELLSTALPAPPPHQDHPGRESLLALAAAAAALAGPAIAAILWGPGRRRERALGAPAGAGAHRWIDAAASGFGFDALYARALGRPGASLVAALRRDPVDEGIEGMARAVETIHRLLRRTQTGRLRWYAAGVAAGSALLLALVLL